MRVIVLIPCLNEEQTLPLVFDTMPKHIAGVDKLEVLIVNDGSTDRTVEVAKKHGVQHFVHHAGRRGLGRSFQDGIHAALELGADIVVTTDGDNQYPQDRIPELVQPILEGKADIVIGDRQTHTIEHFSPLKKFLQRFGSRVVSLAAGVAIPDAPSGFRAYSKEALLQINTVTRFSYTMETIIQAGYKQLAIASIPITTNPKTRESRLFKSMREHVMKSGAAIIRAFIMYRPSVIFETIGWILFIVGIIPFARFIFFSLVEHQGRGHLQSLVLGSVFLIAAFLCFVCNIIADLIRINRTLIEAQLEHTKRMRFK